MKQQQQKLLYNYRPYGSDDDNDVVVAMLISYHEALYNQLDLKLKLLKVASKRFVHFEIS